MNREILEKPFEPGQIKQREGPYGRMLGYVEGHAVIRRLNDAFDSDWSFSILEHRVLTDADEVIVLGQLRADNVVKTQFGSSRITRVEGSGQIVSIADDLKAAATDALKKTATLLGVGLHLYAGPWQQPQEPRLTPHNGSNGGNGNGGRMTGCQGVQDYPSNPGNGNGNGNGNGRITRKQRNYAKVLSDDIEMPMEALNRHCVEVYGSDFENLSRQDASDLIRWLMAP